jgi:hypothetical protein
MNCVDEEREWHQGGGGRIGFRVTCTVHQILPKYKIPQNRGAGTIVAGYTAITNRSCTAGARPGKVAPEKGIA